MKGRGERDANWTYIEEWRSASSAKERVQRTGREEEMRTRTFSDSSICGVHSMRDILGGGKK